MGGNSNSQGIKTLHIAQLNYSGLLNSPFEFFSEELYKE